MEAIYKAHINETTKEVQTVKEHSENTANLCRNYAVAELKEVMYAIGLLHDVGKYQKSFQERINGKNIRVEHSMCGALVAKEKYPNPLRILMEYCIAGHHSGIPDGGFPSDSEDQSTLMGRMKRHFDDFSFYQQELKLPSIDLNQFMKYMMKDCIDENQLVDKFAFITRYCYSCLVDADAMDTARFCNHIERRGMKADFTLCLEKLNAILDGFVCTTRLQKCRAELQKQVFSCVDSKANIYMMNMPTGSGKTLCSMKFALERAIREKKSRIIYVIPYNSIIDQTAETFETIFGNAAEILRHQSTFCIEDNLDGNEDDKTIAKQATENWNAQIIITTAVQFFESIYSNRRSKLRKLHNMADSILVFDEVHTMPLAYLQPCLEGVSFLTRFFHSEAIFLTATMPDFVQWIRSYVMSSVSFQNLLTDQSLFPIFQKCTYHYVKEMTMEDLLQRTRAYPSSLVITNQRNSARALYQNCTGKKYHLSTYMTAYDRSRIIKQIKEEIARLEEEFAFGEEIPDERKITVISTSLIEAGVDLDFHAVFRELSGLEHILQSGGRCNREGKRENGEVYIFSFQEKERKPQKDLGAEITRGILKKYENISSPDCMKEYYQKLFTIEGEKTVKEAMYQYTTNITSLPFAEYAKNFQLIDSEIISVVVPCDKYSREQVEEIRQKGYGDIRKLQKYAASVYPFQFEILRQQGVVDDFGSGIWCLTNEDYYDQEIGILFDVPDYFL